MTTKTDKLTKTDISAVSIRADSLYRAALKEVARRRKTTVGDVVRAALDAMYGTEVASILIFYTLSGNVSDQSVKVKKSKGRKS